MGHCQSHKESLNIYGGQLFGQPGKYHEKHVNDYDLNIFLNAGHIPEEVPFVFGLPTPKFNQPQPAIIAFPLVDGHAPDEGEFLDYVIETANKTLLNKGSVAVSCFGGHGRTGTIMAILWGIANPEDPDPIATIRSMYCKSAIESWSQEKFIFEYLGQAVPDLYKEDKKPTFTWKDSNIAGGHTYVDLTPEFTLDDCYDSDAGEEVAVVVDFIFPIIKVSNGGLARFLCKAPTCTSEMHLSNTHDRVLECLICNSERELPDWWAKGKNTLEIVPTGYPRESTT